MTSKTHVLLIQKQKPPELMSLWNGVGGYLAQGEEPAEAMVREFREEVGIETTAADWSPVCVVQRGEEEIHVFRAVGDIGKAEQRQAERPIIYPLLGLDWNREPVCPLLKWLAPMALSGEIHEPPTIVCK